MSVLEILQGKVPKLAEQLTEINNGIFTCWIGGSDDVIDGAYNYKYSLPDMTNPYNWVQEKIILDEQGIRTSTQLVWYSMAIAKRFRGLDVMSLMAGAIGTENKPLDVRWKNIETFRLQPITMMEQKRAGSYCILLFRNQSINRREWIALRFHYEEVLRIFVHQLEEREIHLESVAEQNHIAGESDSGQDVDKGFRFSDQDFASFPLEREIAQVEEKTVLKVMEKLSQKETADLMEIWNTHDTEEWTPEAFEAIRRILNERRDQERES